VSGGYWKWRQSPSTSNIDNRHSNAYKLDLSVGKPRTPVERRVETFDTFSSSRKLSQNKFLYSNTRFQSKPTLAGSAGDRLSPLGRATWEDRCASTASVSCARLRSSLARSARSARRSCSQKHDYGRTWTDSRACLSRAIASGRRGFAAEVRQALLEERR
jgi:hypothetical protein